MEGRGRHGGARASPRRRGIKSLREEGKTEGMLPALPRVPMPMIRQCVAGTLYMERCPRGWSPVGCASPGVIANSLE